MYTCEDLMDIFMNSDDTQEAHRAFTAVYQRFDEELFDFLVRALRRWNPQRYRSDRHTAAAADDVHSNVFLEVERQRRHPHYDPSRPFRPWLYAVASFRLNDYLTAPTHTQHLDDWQLQPDRQQTDGLDSLQRDEFYLELLADFIPQLTLQERVVLLLSRDGLGQLDDEEVEGVLDEIEARLPKTLRARITARGGRGQPWKKKEIGVLLGVKSARISNIHEQLEKKFARWFAER